MKFIISLLILSNLILNCYSLDVYTKFEIISTCSDSSSIPIDTCYLSNCNEYTHIYFNTTSKKYSINLYAQDDTCASTTPISNEFECLSNDSFNVGNLNIKCIEPNKVIDYSSFDFNNSNCGGKNISFDTCFHLSTCDFDSTKNYMKFNKVENVFEGYVAYVYTNDDKCNTHPQGDLKFKCLPNQQTITFEGGISLVCYQNPNQPSDSTNSSSNNESSSNSTSSNNESSSNSTSSNNESSSNSTSSNNESSSNSTSSNNESSSVSSSSTTYYSTILITLVLILNLIN